MPETALRGLSVYTLSERASDRETSLLAARENKDDFVLGLKMPRTAAGDRRDPASIWRAAETKSRSLILARAIVMEAGRETRLLPKPHRSAGFTVLTAPDIPSALIEIGCLSNPDEERLLSDAAHQHRLAQALARAIDDYFSNILRT